MNNVTEELVLKKTAYRAVLFCSLLTNSSVMKTMLRFFPSAIMALLITVCLSSCVAAGSLFSSGIWTGVILVVVVIGLVFWLISKFSGGGGGNSNV